MDESITAETKGQARQKPPLSVGRIAGEILAGLAVAVPVLFVAVYVLIRAIPGGFEEHAIGTGALVFVFVSFAFPLLYGPASAIGVYVVGSRGKQTGSFLLTLGAGFLGGIVTLMTLCGTFLLLEVLTAGVERVVVWPCGALVFLTAPIIATIAFNQTRRYKKPPSP